MPGSNDIATMEGLKTAIANNEVQRVKQMLTNLVLDELQKSYLIDLADLSGNDEIKHLIEETPAKP